MYFGLIIGNVVDGIERVVVVERVHVAGENMRHFPCLATRNSVEILEEKKW